MDRREFIELFRDGGVRAWLNWRVLEHASPDVTVTELFSADRRQLGDLYTVWYLTLDGVPGDWRNVADRPLRVAEAADSLAVWPAERIERLHGFMEEFRSYREPVRLVLPALFATPRELVLLDGTHRAVAAYRAGVEVRLFIFALDGALSDDLLPDLPHLRRNAAS